MTSILLMVLTKDVFLQNSKTSIKKIVYQIEFMAQAVTKLQKIFLIFHHKDDRKGGRAKFHLEFLLLQVSGNFSRKIKENHIF